MNHCSLSSCNLAASPTLEMLDANRAPTSHKEIPVVLCSFQRKGS